MPAAATVIARVLMAAALTGGCRSLTAQVTFTDPMLLGNSEVSAQVLNQGRETFVQYCYACHGLTGEGSGPASHQYRPPPRDLTAGLYKFGGVVDGLPRDEDLARILRRGLVGTPMLAWDIPESELAPLLQYVKSLAPTWRSEHELGTPIPVDVDPWQGREDEAIELGRRNYHVVASCQQCHPAYLTAQELDALSREVGSPSRADFRPYPDQPAPKESLYRRNGRRLVILPPDFLFNQVRSGGEVRDLYRIISAGIPGTAMPSWYGALPETDVWAIAHYVQSLVKLNGTAQAITLRRRLSAPQEGQRFAPVAGSLDRAEKTGLRPDQNAAPKPR